MEHMDDQPQHNNSPDSEDIRRSTNRAILFEIQRRIEHTNSNSSTLSILTPSESQEKIQDFRPVIIEESQNRIEIEDLIRSPEVRQLKKYLLCRTIARALSKGSVGIFLVDVPKTDRTSGLAVSVIVGIPWDPKILDREFPVGTIMAILNPFFCRVGDDFYAIRVDNSSDISIHPSHEEVHKFCPNFGVLNPTELARTPDEWLKLGHDFFKQNSYWKAANAYYACNCSTLSDEDRFVRHLNLSQCYLNCKFAKEALHYAELALQISKFDTRALGCKGAALAQLGRFHETIELLRPIKFATDTEGGDLCKYAINILLSSTLGNFSEQQLGQYDMTSILVHAQANPNRALVTLAEYFGPVVQRSVPGKGRGLFATIAIPPGQLIIAERATSIIYTVQGNESFYTEKMRVFDPLKRMMGKMDSSDTKDEEERRRLVYQLAGHLMSYPAKIKDIYKLYAGPDLKWLDLENNSIPDEIDLNRLYAICAMNDYCSQEDGDVRSEGLWKFASFINHTCVGMNSWWIIKGDFIFIRASRAIAAGEEITTSYQLPLLSRQERATYFQAHEFTCGCQLCLVDELDSEEVHLERDQLLTEFKSLGSSSNVAAAESIPELERIVAALTNLRANHPEYNASLVLPLEKLAEAYHKAGLHVEAVLAQEKVYQLSKSLLFPHLILQNLVLLLVYLASAQMMERAQEMVSELQLLAIKAYGNIYVLSIIDEESIQYLQASGLQIF